MKFEFKCVGASKFLSPKQEDNVTRFDFLAVAAPQGKHMDIFIEKLQLWHQNHGAYQVSKTYTLETEGWKLA